MQPLGRVPRRLGLGGASAAGKQEKRKPKTHDEHTENARRANQARTRCSSWAVCLATLSWVGNRVNWLARRLTACRRWRLKGRRGLEKGRFEAALDGELVSAQVARLRSCRGAECGLGLWDVPVLRSLLRSYHGERHAIRPGVWQAGRQDNGWQAPACLTTSRFR